MITRPISDPVSPPAAVTAGVFLQVFRGVAPASVNAALQLAAPGVYWGRSRHFAAEVWEQGHAGRHPRSDDIRAIPIGQVFRRARAHQSGAADWIRTA